MDTNFPYRIGQGFDIHALMDDDRPLIIGGVTLDYPRSLKGHSDADVLLHAITDALLGAAALGDIGRHFPDTDSKWKNANSQHLLKQVYDLVQQKGYILHNLDATLIAQQPKMAPYIPLMTETIAKLLNCSIEQVNIKAKTMERLGAIGREEGIMAECIVLIKTK